MWSCLSIQVPSHWLEATCGKFDLLQGQGSVLRISDPLIVPCGWSSGRCTLIPTTTGSNLILWRMRSHGRFTNKLCYKMAAVEEMGRNESIIKVKTPLWAGTFVGIQERTCWTRLGRWEGHMEGWTHCSYRKEFGGKTWELELRKISQKDRGMEGGREGKRKKEWKERKKGGGRV